MKTRKDHVKALMDYHKSFYMDESYPTLFSLKQKMLEYGICPKCGTHSHSWNSISGHFPCDKCGFTISEKELEKVLWDDDNRINEKMQKSILKRRFKLASPKSRKVSK